MTGKKREWIVTVVDPSVEFDFSSDKIRRNDSQSVMEMLRLIHGKDWAVSKEKAFLDRLAAVQRATFYMSKRGGKSDMQVQIMRHAAATGICVSRINETGHLEIIDEADFYEKAKD